LTAAATQYPKRYRLGRRIGKGGQFGRFEARLKLPYGQGIWPAFWLLPASGAWPPEIDVIEAHGDKPNITFHTLHSEHETQGAHKVKAPADDGQFHTYGVLWQPDRIEWYVDDQLTASEPTPKDMHQPMFVIANLAIGGKWPGDPDADTPFPAQMEIDYIRAWSLERPTAP
jgi:beta-glucanase (GH16 family)